MFRRMFCVAALAVAVLMPTVASAQFPPGGPGGPTPAEQEAHDNAWLAEMGASVWKSMAQSSGGMAGQAKVDAALARIDCEDPVALQFGDEDYAAGVAKRAGGDNQYFNVAHQPYVDGQVEFSLGNAEWNAGNYAAAAAHYTVAEAKFIIAATAYEVAEGLYTEAVGLFYEAIGHYQSWFA